MEEESQVPEHDERCLRLARRFRKQAEFSQKNSPLSACICGLVADWLAPESREEEIRSWMVRLGEKQSSFALPMLLLAALHREILRGHPDFVFLANFYPTVGGGTPPDQDVLAPEIRRILLAHQDALGQFMGTSSVQTNETARGLCWLLPLSFVSWKQVSLVDLGCSAGLNLVADQRGYYLERAGKEEVGICFGQAAVSQFMVRSKGAFVLPETVCIPEVTARIGCDLYPFRLETQEDKLRLSSFVWGDQVERMQRLREGIAALDAIQQTDAPVQLFQADLPGELPGFLQSALPRPTAPTVVYNTYLRPYLPDNGKGLQRHLKKWTATHEQPLLWIQWELPPKGVHAPELGWLAWTVELFQGADARKWTLGWVHPHGLQVQWSEGIRGWADFWNA